MDVSTLVRLDRIIHLVRCSDGYWRGQIMDGITNTTHLVEWSDLQYAAIAFLTITRSEQSDDPLVKTMYTIAEGALTSVPSECLPISLREKSDP